MTRADALAAVADARGRLEAVEAFLLSLPAEAPQPAPAPSPGPGLADPAAFFAALRSTKVLGPVLTDAEVQGCNVILDACESRFPLSWTAYTLATAYHETAATMQPIKERGEVAYFHRMYDIEGARPHKARELGNLTPGDGVRYAGRGFVQITGRANYERAGRELGQPLVADPDLAMRPDIAAAIMVRGLSEGWFTGKSLRDYIPAAAERRHYVNARRTVNGTDRADDIADYALVFERALKAGGWK